MIYLEGKSIFYINETEKKELVAEPGRGRVNEYSVMIVIDCSLLMSDVSIIKSDLDFFCQMAP